jgi:hypothetical protein
VKGGSRSKKHKEDDKTEELGYQRAQGIELACGRAKVTGAALRKGYSMLQPVDSLFHKDQDFADPKVRERVFRDIDNAQVEMIFFSPPCTPYNCGYTVEIYKQNHPTDWRRRLRKTMDKWDKTFVPVLEKMAERVEKRNLGMIMETSGKSMLLSPDEELSCKGFREIVNRLKLRRVDFDQCVFNKGRYRKHTTFWTNLPTEMFGRFGRCQCPKGKHTHPLKGVDRDTGEARCATAAEYPQAMAEAIADVMMDWSRTCLTSRVAAVKPNSRDQRVAKSGGVAILDTGAQISMVGHGWKTLETYADQSVCGVPWGATGQDDGGIRLPLGTAASVAKLKEGTEVLLVAHEVGIVNPKMRDKCVSVLDPYQLYHAEIGVDDRAKPWGKQQLIVGDDTIPLAVVKGDVALTTRMPEEADLRPQSEGGLRRIILTRTGAWNRKQFLKLMGDDHDSGYVTARMVCDCRRREEEFRDKAFAQGFAEHFMGNSFGGHRSADQKIAMGNWGDQPHTKISSVGDEVGCLGLDQNADDSGLPQESNTNPPVAAWSSGLDSMGELDSQDGESDTEEVTPAWRGSGVDGFLDNIVGTANGKIEGGFCEAEIGTGRGCSLIPKVHTAKRENSAAWAADDVTSSGCALSLSSSAIRRIQMLDETNGEEPERLQDEDAVEASVQTMALRSRKQQTLEKRLQQDGELNTKMEFTRAKPGEGIGTETARVKNNGRHGVRYKELESRLMGFASEEALRQTAKCTTRLARYQPEDPHRRYFGSPLELSSKFKHLNEGFCHDTLVASEFLEEERQVGNRKQKRKRQPAGNYKYAQVFVGVKSHFLYVYLMTRKSQVVDSINAFFTDVGLPEFLRTDSCGEGATPQVKRLLYEHQVRKQFTEPLTPHQNGSERYVGVLKEGVRRLYDHLPSDSDRREWPFALKYLATVHNKTASRSLHGVTPFEACHGTVPDLSDLRFCFLEPVDVFLTKRESPFPNTTKRRARWLGPCEDHGGVLTSLVRYEDTGTVGIRSTMGAVHPCWPTELKSGEEAMTGIEVILDKEPSAEEQRVVQELSDEKKDEEILEEMLREAKKLEGKKVRQRIGGRTHEGHVRSAIVAQGRILFEIEFDDKQMEPQLFFPAQMIKWVVEEKPRPDGDTEGTPLDEELNLDSGFDGEDAVVEYLVERIVGHGIRRCRRNEEDSLEWVFRIKWIGYKTPTWEPCTDILEDIPQEAADYILDNMSEKDMEEKLQKMKKSWVKWKVELQRRYQAMMEFASGWTIDDDERVPVAVRYLRAEEAYDREYWRDPPGDVETQEQKPITWLGEPSTSSASVWVSPSSICQMGAKPAKRAAVTAPMVVKYGVPVPRGQGGRKKEDEKYDANPELSRLVAHQRWRDALKEELDRFLDPEVDALELVEGHLPIRPGYQQVRCHTVFDVKTPDAKYPTGRLKARFVAGGNTVDTSGLDTYLSVMELQSVGLLLSIADANNMEVLSADIKNAYLSSPVQEKVYIRLGEEWGEHAGKVAYVKKAIYGLRTSPASFGNYVAGHMLDLGYRRCRYDANVWMRKCKDGSHYNYCAWYVDDLLMVSSEAQQDMAELSAIFDFKSTGEPDLFLGVHIRRKDNKWSMDPSAYIKEQLDRLVETLPMEYNGKWRTSNVPMNENDAPELDTSPALDPVSKRVFQRYLGVMQWCCTIGRGDIAYATASLSRFGQNPRVGHFDRALKVFEYLNKYPDKSLTVDSTDIPELPVLDDNMVHNMKKLYPDSLEEVDPGDPKPLGREIQISVFEDSNFAHDAITRKSITGIVAYVGQTPIRVKSTRQTAIQSSTYAAEFQASRTGAETALGLRLALRALGVPVKSASMVYSDNLGVVQSASVHSSAIKKKHVSISYHVVREMVASGAIGVAKIGTEHNVADLATKALGRIAFHRLIAALFQLQEWIERLRNGDQKTGVKYEELDVEIERSALIAAATADNPKNESEKAYAIPEGKEGHFGY